MMSIIGDRNMGTSSLGTVGWIHQFAVTLGYAALVDHNRSV